MVGAYLQTSILSHAYVAHVSLVNVVAAFSSFKVDVVHTTIVTNSLPKYVALIVTHVQAMNMVTCVLALYIVLCFSTCHRQHCDYDYYEFSNVHGCKDTII